jgi:hypothetical protein
MIKKENYNLLNNYLKQIQVKRKLLFLAKFYINLDGRVSLKDFERQSSILLGERVNLLLPFYSSSTRSSTTNDNQIIVELRREIASCRSTINELQDKIITCEKSQRLSEQVEIEYEDLLKFVYEQLRQHKLNEINQLRLIRANDQLIKKVFNYLSTNMNKPNDQQILSQFKYEYEKQQQQILSSAFHQNSSNTSILSNKNYQQQI